MEVKLVVIGGKHSGQEIPVPGPQFLIGRAADCHLRPGSDLVSRRHCAIVIAKGSVTVRDFNSRNGTYVNGQRIEAERELKTGDHLKVGPLEFEVQLAVEVGGKRKSKVHSVQEAAARTVEAAADDDLDIFDLLGEEAEEPAFTRTADTKSTSVTPTGGGDTAKIASASEEPPGEITQELTEEEAKERPKKKKKKKDNKEEGIVGKFADKKGKPIAESSRSAAKDMLKQFIHPKK